MNSSKESLFQTILYSKCNRQITFEVLTMVKMKIIDFWYVALCSLVGGASIFRVMSIDH
jgi:hypothetical protein